MGLQSVKEKLGVVNNTPAKKPTSFPEMLMAYKDQIAAALPKHLDADRMARIALTCFRTVPKLAQCEPKSVFAAVIQASQMGLEVGMGGEAFLIPFDKKGKVNGQWQVVSTECQLIVGYPGLIKLAMNSGRIDFIDAQVVYDNDTFDLTLGLEQNLVHKPELYKDRGSPVLVYGVVRYKDSPIPLIDFMTKSQVHAIRDKSQGYQGALAKIKKYPNSKVDNPWLDPDQEPEMWRKTMIRRISKRLPKSAELQTAVNLDDRADHGKEQNIDINQAIAGDFIVLDDTGEEVDQETGEINPQEQMDVNEAENTQANLDYILQMIDKARTKKAKTELISQYRESGTLSNEKVDELIATYGL